MAWEKKGEGGAPKKKERKKEGKELEPEKDRKENTLKTPSSERKVRRFLSFDAEFSVTFGEFVQIIIQ